MEQHEQLRVAPASPEEVSEEVRVRHFDELDEQAQQDLFSAVHGDGSLASGTEENKCLTDGSGEDVTGLVEGDVIVFTDYYRIR